jgi:Septum formation
MRRRRWQTVAPAAAVMVSLGLLLSGCFAIAGPVAVQAAVNGKQNVAKKDLPRTGECWQASFDYAEEYATWGASPAVRCDEAHQLYTFAVSTLSQIHKGKLFDKSGYPYQAIADDAYFTCGGAEEIQLPTFDDTVARVRLEAYLPTEEQWDAGARWVRCDVGVYKFGSSVANPTFEDLPSIAALNRAIKDAPTQFDFCVDDPGGLGSGGPKGGSAVYADCRGGPEWKFQTYQYITTGQDNTYPTPAEMNAQFELSCQHAYADSTHVTYAYYPSKSDWDGGDQELECWVGRIPD